MALRLLCVVAAVMLAASSGDAQSTRATGTGALKPGEAFKECRDCPEMVVVPPGSFTSAG
jgi:formylglycine-generating enzyme required for sulfatase activity